MSTGPFDGTTTYGDAFVGHPLEKREIMAPPVRLPQGKFEGTTSYHDSFVPHEITTRCASSLPSCLSLSAPRSPAAAGLTLQNQARRCCTTPNLPSTKPLRLACPNLANISDTTCRASASPTYQPRSTGAFDGTTTYKSYFHPHKLPDKPQYEAPVAREQARFDATTTNQDTYKAYEEVQREVAGPPRVVKPHIPFDGTTTSHVCF